MLLLFYGTTRRVHAQTLTKTEKTHQKSIFPIVKKVGGVNYPLADATHKQSGTSSDSILVHRSLFNPNGRFYLRFKCKLHIQTLFNLNICLKKSVKNASFECTF